ncbi:hypothetical protein C0584_02925 [Candidatus Parcubacteria bacterium]|nr:MAG: hypothetical protein C0584_02925 [Candidatus Parcubacteria bacterium]
MYIVYLSSQLITWIVYKFIGRCLLNLKVEGQENFKDIKTRGVLFISSHHSSLDPFLIGGATPFWYYIKTKGFRYMTYYKFIWQRLYSPYIIWQGAYPVYPKKGELKDVLESTVKKLKQGYNIMMFPGGKKRDENGIIEAKPGVAYLAKELNPQIVPVNISGTRNTKFIDFLKRNRKVRIAFGRPFYYKDVYDEGMDLIKLAKAIKEKTLI